MNSSVNCFFLDGGPCWPWFCPLDHVHSCCPRMSLQKLEDSSGVPSLPFPCLGPLEAPPDTLTSRLSFRAGQVHLWGHRGVAAAREVAGRKEPCGIHLGS